jgi:2-oxoglutarate dehydrogenase complex dehydrogenase (E1) component-like enzyme
MEEMAMAVAASTMSVDGRVVRAAAQPRLHEMIWLQEEPKNMGAWSYMAPRLRALIGCEPRISSIGWPVRASSAVDSPLLHRAEQGRIVAEAYSGLYGP